MAGGKTIGIPLIPRKTVYLLSLSNPERNF